MKNKGTYLTYGFIALISLALIIVVIIYYNKSLEGMTSNIGFGNKAKEFTFNEKTGKVSNVLQLYNNKNDKYVLNLDSYVNIIGFRIDTFDNSTIRYRIKVENELLNEYFSINNNNEFKSGKYYDIRKNNYNVNQLLLTNDINSDNLDPLNNIKSIKIYGIRQFDKLVDDDIEIIPNYDTKTMSIEFNKLLDVKNIEYYFAVIAKYDKNNEFLSKQIIRINNNKINFIAELEKLIPNQFIKYPFNTTTTQASTTTTTMPPFILSSILEDFDNNNKEIKIGKGKIDENTSIKEAANILINYDENELLDVFKLILKNKYLNSDKNVDNLLIYINEYSTMKFLKSGDTSQTTNKDFKTNYENNYYYYQSDYIKELLKYVYDLIENYDDNCNNYSCAITSPKLDILDRNGFPFKYKIGVGYTRLDVLGNEIYSPITPYRDNNGEVLITMVKDKKKTDDELSTGDNLFNKLKLINKSAVKELKGIIGSNYPNNFEITEQNLQDYVNLDEYIENNYSPIQFDVNIIDKTESDEVETEDNIITTTTQNISSFDGNYNNPEDLINDLIN